MSSQTDFEVSDFVFYVDELEDDFTFYVSAASNDDYIKALKKVAESNSTAEAAGERFSFSEQITFTNLIPNEKSPGIGDGFFEQFSKPSPGLAAKYLLALLEQAKASETDAELITNLQNRSLTDEEKKSFAPLLVKALKLVDPADREWTADLQLSSEDQKLRTQLEAEPGLQRKLTRFLLERAFPNLEWQRKKGRALICFSHARKALSITVRKLDEQVGYEPSRLEDVDQKNREKYLFSVAEYCAPIYEQVFTETESTEKAQGLLVITGPTKSLKSEITRGLIHLYLTQRAKKGRRPHLVTFEDPIERFYSDAAKDGFTGPSRVALALRDEPYYVNYTARQKEKDASFLRDALTDALRQTPAVFFVGETRDKREWEVLLDFASTGHLVVTTAHAGSLVEAMRKIFEARVVKTPADRGEIASKLLAVINLKPGRIELEGASPELVFPALWRRTPRGAAALTSDGLSSLLPHRTSENRPSCLGRRWFIEELVNEVEVQMEKVFRPAKLLESLKATAFKQATHSDLQGV